MKLEIEVADCRDCPMARDHRGHGECWTYCAHPNNGRGAYEDILWGCGAEFEAVPDWCPIKEKNG